MFASNVLRISCVFLKLTKPLSTSETVQKSNPAQIISDRAPVKWNIFYIVVGWERLWHSLESRKPVYGRSNRCSKLFDMFFRTIHVHHLDVPCIPFYFVASPFKISLLLLKKFWYRRVWLLAHRRYGWDGWTAFFCWKKLIYLLSVCFIGMTNMNEFAVRVINPWGVCENYTGALTGCGLLGRWCGKLNVIKLQR